MDFDNNLRAVANKTGYRSRYNSLTSSEKVILRDLKRKIIMLECLKEDNDDEDAGINQFQDLLLDKYLNIIIDDSNP